MTWHERKKTITVLKFKVFAAGDMRRGQSLVVGRSAKAARPRTRSTPI
jgi:NADPH-dependent glutamate synthase beta subunit-like oxidoreductase